MNEIFILDFSGGNLCKNQSTIITQMITELAKVDPERKSIIKWQLFKKEKDNIPLEFIKFRYAVRKAIEFGFKTTASIFDEESLMSLLNFNIPFVKIANRPDLYCLIGCVPRNIPVILSYSPFNKKLLPENCGNNIAKLVCVSKYPATQNDYEGFDKELLSEGISDHTTNWNLYKKYQPKIYECHYCLEHDKSNPDGGLFSRTPAMLKEIL